MKDLRTNDPAKYYLKVVKDRSRKKGLEFDLDYEWIKEKFDNGVCEISGERLDFTYTPGTTGNSAYSEFTPSIDRIDSSRGYLKENCQVVCIWINRAKGISSMEEFEKNVLKLSQMLNKEF